MGFGTVVETIPENLLSPKAVKRVAECDVLFGCMDGAEGRFFLNKIASFYSIPYIDVGVRLDADGHGGISQICGTVYYLRPGGSSLLSRGAITMKAVEAEGLKRTNSETYESQVKSKYIMGVQEGRPAVISVNMHYASLAVIELLARLHPFRVEGKAPLAGNVASKARRAKALGSSWNCQWWYGIENQVATCLIQKCRYELVRDERVAAQE